jgi:hypothetical protein
MISMRQLALVFCTALLAGAAWQSALACACCSNPGDRTDIVMKLDKGYVEELAQLRFERTAMLFLGEAEPDTVKGITTASEKYELEAAWKEGRIVFAFRDEAGRSGTLTLTQPKTISLFRVDPRNQPDNPRAPRLYKEWRVTSKAAGTGVFAAGLGAGQTLTLILQGGGNNCTSANDFTHWMLVMWGPKAKYHFYGSLVTTK